MGVDSEKKEENPYRDCCGGVWSNMLQIYTGHYNDCSEISQNASTIEKIISKKTAMQIIQLTADLDFDSEDYPGYWGHDTFMREDEIMPKAQAILSEFSLRVSKDASLRAYEEIKNYIEKQRDYHQRRSCRTDQHLP